MNRFARMFGFKRDQTEEPTVLPAEYPPPVWTFHEGVGTARVVESVIRPCGYFTALAGSVLYKGRSFKDLDLLITPLGATPYDEWAARLALCKLNMRKVHECSRGSEYDRSNHRVEVWNDAQGRRIDIFWMVHPEPTAEVSE
jgi:hypothetical protein